MADFVHVIQIRHYQECGGFYFTINYIFGLAYVYLGLYLHGLYSPADKSDLSHLWPYVQAVTLISFLTTLCFLLIMKRPYLATFLNHRTAKQMIASHFLSTQNDEAKFSVFQEVRSGQGPKRGAKRRAEKARVLDVDGDSLCSSLTPL